MKKKIIIITSVIVGSIILIISIALILLSVLFPNELVRKEIEKQATEYLGVNVKLEKLKFSIFRGFVLNGLSISQKGYGWAYPEILKLDSIVLEYRLFPLLAREISIKGFVIEKGELHLERKKGIANYDYFNKKFTTKDNKKIEIKKETKTVEKKQLTRSEFPINIDIKKCGFDGLLVTYNDDTFFDIPLFADLSQVKFIGRNISLKNNKPFDLESRINIKFNAGKYLEFNAVAKANGNIKIFSGDSFDINPTGPVKIKIDQAGFKSNNINDLIVFFIKDYFNSTLGGDIKSFLNNKNNVAETSDEHFKGIMSNVDDKIKSTINDVEKLMQKKDEALKYKDKLINDFDSKIESSISDVEKKINDIDDKTRPILKAASRLNLITKVIDTDKYEEKISRLKKEAKSRKESLLGKYKSGLSENLMSKINGSFPAKTPTFESVKKQFTSQIEKYKQEINKKLSFLTSESFLDSVFKNFKLFDKEWNINEISTTYILGEGVSQAKDIKFDSNLFKLGGDMNIKGKYLDYTGDMSVIIKEFGLDFLPVNDISAKVKINGTMPNLKIKLAEMPKLDIDKSKMQEIIKGMLGSFLKNNYGENKILSNILGTDVSNVDLESIKKQLENIKKGKLDDFNDEKSKLKDYIDKELNRIINDIKSRAGI